jgi:hypothetical protein
MNSWCNAWPEGQEEPSIINHFAMPIGDWSSKFQRMLQFMKTWMKETPNLINTTISWGTGKISFKEEPVLNTDWGNGTWSKHDGCVIATWRGFQH